MVQKKPAQFARRQVIKSVPPASASPAPNSSPPTNGEDSAASAADLSPEQLAEILGRDSSGPAAEKFTSSDTTLSEKEFRAYMGTNADAFLSTFEASRSSHGGISMGWSWACLFVGPVWLAYRKLWLQLVVFAVISLGSGAGAASLGFTLPFWAYGIATLGMTLVAKSLCVNGAYGAGRRAEQMGHHGSDRLDYMQAIGGTSRLAAVVTIFVYFALELMSYSLIFGGLDKLI